MFALIFTGVNNASIFRRKSLLSRCRFETEQNIPKVKRSLVRQLLFLFITPPFGTVQTTLLRKLWTTTQPPPLRKNEAGNLLNHQQHSAVLRDCVDI